MGGFGCTDREVAFSFSSRGSTHLKQLLHSSEYSNGIAFEGLGQKMFLHITRTYKHLGTVCSSDLSMQPEITKKLAALSEATKAVGRNFLFREALPLEPRLLVLKMMVFSKGLFHAGTWLVLYSCEFSRLHIQIMKIYSSIVDAGIHPAARRSHESLLSVDGLVASYVLLVCMRVRLFVRVITQASPHVLTVLFEARGGQRAWIDAIEHDLQFLSVFSEAFADMAGASMERWVRKIHVDSRGVLSALSKAVDEKRLNSRAAWARSKRLQEIDSTFACSQCSFTACSRQQIAIHAFRAHGRQRAARRIIETVFCPICLQDFHSREKVICHVEEKSWRCRLVLLNCYPQSLAERKAELHDKMQQRPDY